MRINRILYGERASGEGGPQIVSRTKTDSILVGDAAIAAFFGVNNVTLFDVISVLDSLLVTGDQSVADADFAYRMTLPGIVWGHNFDQSTEVTQFRENGDLSYDPAGVLPPGAGYVNDPTTCEHITSDAVSGSGCLQITRPSGSLDGWNWYRPMSPLSSPGNGRATDDPGADIALDADGAWNPGPGGDQDRTTDWTEGNFGPASTGTWDGDQFFLQYKLKVSASRDNGVFGGKVGYITRQNQTLTAQEIVPSYDYTPKKWRIYTGGTGTLQNELHDASYRSNPSDAQIPEEHYWDEWVEYLIHVVPGGENDSAGGSNPGRGQAVTQPGDTRLNVFQRREGEIGYTHIFQQNFLATDYNNAYQQAWNAIIFSGYFNSANMPSAFTQRFDEAILSKVWIPPGRDDTAASTLETAASNLSDNSYTNDPFTWNPGNSQDDISWQCRTGFYDESRGEIQYMGKAQNGGPARHFRYNEFSDSWVTVDNDVAGDIGHIYTAVAFDHTESPGDYYWIQDRPTDSPNPSVQTANRYNRVEDAWEQLPTAGFNVWQSSTTPNPGMVYHPNLLGPGRPGLFCWSVDRWSYFDPVNQSWTSVRSDIRYVDPYGGTGYNGWKLNMSIYVPGLDIALYGSGTTGYVSSVPQCLVVEAGSGGDQNHSTYDMPQQVCSDDYASGTYDMILDPRDPTRSTIMLLEKNGGNVYTSNNPQGGLAAWTLESFSHPFWNNNPYRSTDAVQLHSWTAASIPRYGVVLGMGSYNGGGSVLWRPGT